MISVVSAALGFLLQLGAATTAQPPANAGGTFMLYDRAGIERWAICSWKKAPVSAANWLRAEKGEKVAAKPGSNPFAEPKNVLALRLNHVCGDMLSPSDRRSSFAESAKIMVLTSNRPATHSQRDIDMNVLVCEHWVRKQLLKTDLSPIVKPKSGNGIKVRCFRALDDGSLINA